jgi:hypothetical protein
MGRKWVYRPGHPDASPNGFVEITAAATEARAVDAPILTGRFYENTKAIDGADIGSRRKHQTYMKDRGLAPTNDFSPQFYESQKKAERLADTKDRREAIARATWEVFDNRK